MITLNQAKRMLEASEAKARELGVAVSTVVVDEHGVMVAMSKMDGAIPISPKFARTKAYTSANIGMPTEGLAPFDKEGKPYHGLGTIFGGELTTIAGGVPVMKDDKVVGAVGVGGSADVGQDADCAQAAAMALE